MTPAIADRPLRRDAARNRQRVLDAAAAVLAERGGDAGVEEIARKAGVGMGTVYRRFPTKDALINALVDDVLRTMLGFAEAAAVRGDGTGLERFLEAAGRSQADHRGCLSRLWSAGSQRDVVARMRRAISGLLADAKQHGRVRDEVTTTDITTVLWSLRGVIETTGAVAPDAWRRHLAIVVAGLRPAGPPLTHRPLTRAQVDRIIAGT